MHENINYAIIIEAFKGHYPLTTHLNFPNVTPTNRSLIFGIQDISMMQALSGSLQGFSISGIFCISIKLITKVLNGNIK